MSDIPQMIDNRYQVVRLLGRGGMADVYLATDAILGRQVAVKVLDARHASDAEFVKRFHQEARAAAGLSNSHIVAIHDRGATDDSHYIVMEYIEGRTLSALLAEKGPLAPEQAIAIALDVLDALAAAHERGIIHRDVKPQNIIIDQQGRVKVADFGIARTIELTTRVTTAGSILGTAHYLSPEQAAGIEAVYGSDLYSLGVVLFEMLTGQVPFDGENLVAVMHKHLNQQPPSPRQLNPSIPENLSTVVLNALAKDPARRYASAGQFAGDLGRCRQGTPVASAALPLTTVEPQAAPAPRAYCPACGAANPKDNLFCNGCGSRMAAAAPVPPPAYTGPSSDEATRMLNQPAPAATPPAGKKARWRRRAVAVAVAAVIALVALAGIGMYAASGDDAAGGTSAGDSSEEAKVKAFTEGLAPLAERDEKLENDLNSYFKGYDLTSSSGEYNTDEAKKGRAKLESARSEYKDILRQVNALESSGSTDELKNDFVVLNQFYIDETGELIRLLDYIDQLYDAISRFRKATDRLTSSDPADAAEAVALINELNNELVTVTDDLNALDVPESFREYHDSLTAALLEMSALFDEIAVAITTEDAAKMAELETRFTQWEQKYDQELDSGGDIRKQYDAYWAEASKKEDRLIGNARQEVEAIRAKYGDQWVSDALRFDASDGWVKV